MSARRSALLCAIVLCAGALAWVSWPGHVLQLRERGGIRGVLTGALPAVTIHVMRGGTASLLTRQGAVPLPDTVFVEGGTPAIIRLENSDTVAHRLGLFGVPAGETREYTISHAGTYAGYCTAHPSRLLTYIVR
jgi:hypothetical protein